MHQPGAVRGIEAPTRVEPDHHHLRRAELATAVAKVAQAATGEVLAHREVHPSTSPGGLADVEHLGEVRMAGTDRVVHRRDEPLVEPGSGAQVGMHDLEGDPPVGEGVDRLEQGQVGRTAPPAEQAVATGEDPLTLRTLGRAGGIAERAEFGAPAGRSLVAHRNRDATRRPRRPSRARSTQVRSTGVDRGRPASTSGDRSVGRDARKPTRAGSSRSRGRPSRWNPPTGTRDWRRVERRCTARTARPSSRPGGSRPGGSR
ncbi:unannotated protein [freshwater metagenome]|uniref:Unannotated protein n=1 Tax=freshwater metagenome TaxID=449393 RepID=A0A6J6CG97_9ZZZZ